MTGFSLDEDLPAEAEGAGAPRLRVWEPPGVAVVLGRGNDDAREVRGEACKADEVPVLRRLGGGGAVVLAPGCLVASWARPVARPLAVGEHLRDAVGLLARVLGATTGLVLAARGTGDLCLGDRKVAGSSAFARRGVFLYQASVLVDVDLAWMDRYLKHPSAEPAYRAGRPHEAFVTTLARGGWGGGVWGLLTPLSRGLQDELERER